MRPVPLTTKTALPVPSEVADRLRDWVRFVLDLPQETLVQVSQLRRHDTGPAPMETVLAVLRPGAPFARTIPLPAGQVCAADVLTALHDLPRRTA